MKKGNTSWGINRVQAPRNTCHSKFPHESHRAFSTLQNKFSERLETEKHCRWMILASWGIHPSPQGIHLPRQGIHFSCRGNGLRRLGKAKIVPRDSSPALRDRSPAAPKDFRGARNASLAASKDSAVTRDESPAVPKTSLGTQKDFCSARDESLAAPEDFGGMKKSSLAAGDTSPRWCVAFRRSGKAR